MKNTDYMNLSLPEGTDKIDIEILNNDFKKLESEASKHYIQQQIEVDGTATIVGSVGPYVQLENLTDNILNVNIGDEIVVLMKGDNRKIRTITNANFGIVTSGAVKVTYYINAQTYADENFYKKEKVDELLENVEATVEVDAELSEVSENPVQNKVITAELANYATTAEVESKVTEKVAEIVAGAPEDFDTLKEMSDWLTEHEDSAATMNSAIQKNAEDIATANTNIQKNVDDITAVKNDVAINKSTLGVQCKNLLPNNIKSRNWNGVEITKYDDGSFNLNGTMAATSTQFLQIGEIDASIVIGKKIKISGINITYQIDLRDSDDKQLAAYTKNSDFELTTNNENLSSIRIMIQASSNTVYDNVTVYPMLKFADITDSTYEPYKPNINKQFESLDANIQNIRFEIADIYNRCGGGKNLYNIADKTTTASAFIINDKPVSFSCDSIIVSFDFSGTPGVNTLRLIDDANNIISSNATNPKSGARGSVILESAKKAAKIRWWADGYGTFSNIMIRPAYIEDDTYVPYIPTIQELIARIEVLEGTTITTEGGE